MLHITNHVTRISLVLLTILHHQTIHAVESQEPTIKQFNSNLPVQIECQNKYESNNHGSYTYVSGDCDEFGRPNGYAVGKYVYSYNNKERALTVEGPFINGVPANNEKFTVRYNRKTNDSEVNYMCDNVGYVDVMKRSKGYREGFSLDNITCSINSQSLRKWEKGAKYEATIKGKLRIGDNPCDDCIVFSDATIISLVASKTPFLCSDPKGPISPFGSYGSLFKYEEANKYTQVKDGFARNISLFSHINVKDFAGKVTATLANSSNPLVFHENTEKDATMFIDNEGGERLHLAYYNKYSNRIIIGFKLPDGTSLVEAKGFKAKVGGTDFSSYAHAFTNLDKYRSHGYKGPVYNFEGIYLAPKFGQLTLANGEIKNGVFGTWGQLE